jgi:hypothetical protein
MSLNEGACSVCSLSRSRSSTQSGLLERLGVGHRHVGARHPANRRVEPVEGLLLDQRREVGADAAVGPALLDDHGAVGLADRLEDRVEVERAQRARVERTAPALCGGPLRV